MPQEVILRKVVGRELLDALQNSYLKYLESSAAIYELNGDYATALFTSRYCDFLNQASKRLAGDVSEEKALKSGKWICHEDCWATSQKSIKDKKPYCIECSGGILIYAAPIIAGDTVLGSNNAGVSNPPTDKKTITAIANKYRVNPEELLEIAKAYPQRPNYVFKAAKNHILGAADMIAEIYIRRRTEEKLAKSEQRYCSLFEDSLAAVCKTTLDGRILDCNQAFVQIMGYKSRDEMVGIGAQDLYFSPEDRERFLSNLTERNLLTAYESRLKRKDGQEIWVLENVSSIGSETIQKTMIDITGKKQTEKVLKESKEKYRTIFETTGTATVIIEADTILSLVNSQFEKLSGYPKQEIEGRKSWIDFVMKDDLEQMKEYHRLRRVNEESAPTQYDFRFVDRHGKVKHISLNIAMIPGTGESVASLLDITNRKQVETELGHSKAFLEEVLQTTPAAIFTVDNEKCFTSWNRMAEKITGYQADEVIGKSCDILLSDTCTEECRLFDEKFSKPGGYGKCLITGKDGQQIITLKNIDLLHDTVGEITGGIESFIDITERERTEIMLRESEDSYRTFAENLPGMVYRVFIRENNRMHFFNSMLQPMTGYKTEELKNGDVCSIEHFIVPEDLPGVVTTVKHAIMQKKSFEIEYRFRHKTGDILYFLERGRPIHGTDGKPLYIDGVIFDVTERKRAEKTIIQKTEDLALLNALNLAANRGATLEEVLRLLQKETKRIFNSYGATLYLLSQDEKYLEMQNFILPEAAVSKIEKLIGVKIPPIRIPMKKGSPYESIIRNEQPQLINDPDTILALMGEFVSNLAKPQTKVYNAINKILPKTLKMLGLQSVINIPLISDTKTVGVLDISSKELFTESDVDRYQLLAEAITSIVLRKKADDELRVKEQYYRLLLQSIHEDILVIDRDYRIVDINNSFMATVKLKREEVIGKYCYQVSHSYNEPCDRRGEQCQLLEVFFTGESRNCHHEHIKSDGSVIDVDILLSPMKDETGNVTHVIESIRDVSDLLDALTEVKESEEKFRGVIEQSNDGIYVLQEDRIVFINPRYTELTGYQLEELKSEDFDFKELLAEEGLKVLEDRKEILKGGNELPNRYIFKSLRKDGQMRDMEVSVTEVEWEGKPATLGVLHDVTERIQTQMELEQALGKAQAGEKVKTLFLENMSHEIRTPLNAILGFTDLIEARTRHLVREEEQEFFDTIKNSGTRLMNTVHEILDISQIESGTYQLKMEQLDLIKLVKELVHTCQPIADDKNLELAYKSNLDSAYIQADKNGLSQAINNIIDNAIKYTEQGKITVLLEQSSNHYVLSIQDTGIGISKAYSDKLFEVFSQESEGYTKKFQGIGLGMAITKRQLDLNHVDIHVESTKGVGTTFILTFKPVKKRIPEKQVEKEEAKATPTVEPAEKPLVLLVEDDLGSQKLIEFFLKAKFDIYFAVSVKEAKQQLKKHPIDLILLDLSLIGNEDGLDLVRWMRKTKTWQKTPVIATTAHAFNTDRDNCIAAGCDDYLSKPIKREKLLERISEFVEYDQAIDY